MAATVPVAGWRPLAAPAQQAQHQPHRPAQQPHSHTASDTDQHNKRHDLRPPVPTGSSHDQPALHRVDDQPAAAGSRERRRAVTAASQLPALRAGLHRQGAAHIVAPEQSPAAGTRRAGRVRCRHPHTIARRAAESVPVDGVPQLNRCLRPDADRSPAHVGRLPSRLPRRTTRTRATARSEDRAVSAGSTGPCTSHLRRGRVVRDCGRRVRYGLVGEAGKSYGKRPNFAGGATQDAGYALSVKASRQQQPPCSFLLAAQPLSCSTPKNTHDLYSTACAQHLTRAPHIVCGTQASLRLSVSVYVSVYICICISVSLCLCVYARPAVVAFSHVMTPSTVLPIISANHCF